MGNPWEGPDNYRLPTDAYANHYDLYINPNLETQTFEGTVTIHISTSSSKDNFLVHIKDLTISKSTLNRVAEDDSLTVSNN